MRGNPDDRNRPDPSEATVNQGGSPDRFWNWQALRDEFSDNGKNAATAGSLLAIVADFLAVVVPLSFWLALLSAILATAFVIFGMFIRGLSSAFRRGFLYCTIFSLLSFSVFIIQFFTNTLNAGISQVVFNDIKELLIIISEHVRKDEDSPFGLAKVGTLGLQIGQNVSLISNDSTTDFLLGSAERWLNAPESRNEFQIKTPSDFRIVFFVRNGEPPVSGIQIRKDLGSFPIDLDAIPGDSTICDDKRVIENCLIKKTLEIKKGETVVVNDFQLIGNGGDYYAILRRVMK